MEAIVLTVLQLIQSLLSQIGSNNTAVNQIIAALVQIVPLVVNLSTPIINSVKAIITALQNSGALTDDQLATLESLSDEIDAAYQTAVANYLASKKKLTQAAPTPTVSTPVAQPAASASPTSQPALIPEAG
ncbi:hypothetical protein [Rhizobium leguminosarum]|uniref:hypothetical protein n=1 Tax=Rhizobium leguminosarum TaxID=384 RepID=UPI0003F9FB2E|nr:hypothetical protein [Rhizobium leguminosarum]